MLMRKQERETGEAANDQWDDDDDGDDDDDDDDGDDDNEDDDNEWWRWFVRFPGSTNGVTTKTV